MDNLPQPLGVRANYKIASEMVVLNADALQSGSPLNVTMFGDTYTISRDSAEVRGDGDYTWFGSGDQVSDAIFVVNGTQASGLIYTATKTFEVLHVSSSIHEIYDLDISKFPPIGSGQTDLTRAAQTTLDRGLISQLESAYVGWQEYDRGGAETATIDVFVVVTEDAINDYGGSARSMTNLAISNANIAYEENDLPIVLNLVDYYTVRGYDDAGSIGADLDNLMDPDNRHFARPLVLAERENADVVVMLVKDYKHKDDDNEDRRNTCGNVEDHLANDKSTAFGVVESVCIAAQSFTNVIGLMQGAGPNAEQRTNSEFSYGHGHYHAGVDRRTVMSQSSGNCDDPRTADKELCIRERIWSDPHRYFFGTATPAGTADSWNSRVVFATAPHIASLRGPMQSYDSVVPTGSIELPSPLPTSGTLGIVANFSEPIHEWFPPIITITDGIETTTAVMTRSSETAYTYDHMLDGESGTVHLLFSNARDAFGNPVDKNPTSGGTFSITAGSVTPPQLPQGAVMSISDPFDSSLSFWNLWSLPGNGNWATTNPTKGVPDTPQDTNRVIASNDCEDSCIATLKSTLNTFEPLVISFDRYVDKSVSRGEGLHVEYSVDNGTTWTALASYTHENDKDTSRWEKTVIGLSIPESSAMFRLHAKSNQDDEYVEVDNLRIFRPPDAAPDATFSATLSSDLTRIVLAFSHTISQGFSPSNFTLSHGNVTGVSGLNSTIRILNVTDIPYDTGVSVTYVGDTISLEGGVYLLNGTADTTNVITSTLDNTAPQITVPANTIVEATGTLTAVNVGTAIATDDIDPNPTVTNDAPPSFPLGTTTVTWTAEDSSDNVVTATQTVTVQDTTPPTFDEAPQDLSFVFDPDVPLIVNYDSPMATDIVDDSVDISCLPASGTAFGEGATTVTCTATDDYSNSADVTFDVNVRVYDTTVFSDGFEGRVHDSWDSPQFSFWSTGYNVPVTVPGHDSSNKIAHAAGCDFAGGCVMELTDGLNLSNHTDPEFLKFYRYLDTRLDPGDYLKLEAYDGSAWAELDRWNPENSDDDGAWHLEEYDLANYTDSSGFKLRFTAVAGAGIDEFGVDDVLVYKVPEVASNGTALAITAPADVVAEATGTLTAVDIGTATATGGFGNVTISHEPQAPFPLGNTTVTWTALDSNGTSATDTQLVTVQDTTAPTVASITRSDPAGGVTNSTSLIFAVTFSEDVTGVDVSDFALSPNSTGGGASATGQFAQTSEPALPIPDRSTIRDAITVGQSGNATSVSVAVDISHTYIGDLVIDLIAPDGTTRTLHDRTGYETDDIDQTYAPDFAGVSIAGDWTLRVRDGAGGDTGTMNGWTLTINRDATATNPVTSVSGSGSTYDVTVSVTQDGTYNLDLVSSGHGITDGVGNPLSDAAPTGVDETYTVSAN